MSLASALLDPPPSIAKLPLIGWLFSSIGKKTIVSLTGIALVLFVIGHLGGNLTIYFGPDVLNAYAMHLADLGPLLWLIRLGLLAIVTLHIYFTMLLWVENRKARPAKYAVFAPMKTTVFARSMRLTGLVVLAFIIFHLLHFTVRVIDPAYQNLHTMLDGREVHDVYKMVVLGFSNPIISMVYIIAVFLLAMHLSHGVGSLFQTLGLTNKRLQPLFELGGRLLSTVLFLGYASIPVSILVFGLGKDALK
ncbi:MAG: hypothetical protein Fur0032_23220 [Terrimicrobiaceae bacterium]